MVRRGTSASTAVATGLAAGYMDSTHSSVDKMQSFINTTLGVKVVPANKALAYQSG